MTAHEVELKALMLATQRGDAAAYRTLLVKLVPRLRAYYKRRMMGAGRSAEEAQDLVQETLLAVHLKRDTYDPDALFSWLHVEQCDRSRSQRARHRGTEWWSMVSDAGSSRPRSSRPVI